MAQLTKFTKAQLIDLVEKRDIEIETLVQRVTQLETERDARIFQKLQRLGCPVCGCTKAPGKFGCTDCYNNARRAQFMSRVPASA